MASAEPLQYTEAVRRLVVALARPLPGASAQGLMAPRPRANWPAGAGRAVAREAAGLLLVMPGDTGACVVLTVRARSLDRHSGQVSMPGGVIEAGESEQAAALREAQEEIAVDPSTVRVLGALTPVDIAVSGFRLHPVLAVSDRQQVFRPTPEEVDRVLEVPLTVLLRTDTIVWRTSRRADGAFRYPAFLYQDTDIWGATAMVLAEFIALLD